MQEQVRQKKLPQRRCVGCNESRSKQELIRVVRTPDGEVTLDFTGKKSGRGAYLCKQMSCLQKAIKGKRLNSHLQTEIPEEVYLSLQEEMAKGAN